MDGVKNLKIANLILLSNNKYLMKIMIINRFKNKYKNIKIKFNN